MIKLGKLGDNSMVGGCLEIHHPKRSVKLKKKRVDFLNTQRCFSDDKFPIFAIDIYLVTTDCLLEIINTKRTQNIPKN